MFFFFESSTLLVKLKRHRFCFHLRTPQLVLSVSFSLYLCYLLLEGEMQTLLDKSVY